MLHCSAIEVHLLGSTMLMLLDTHCMLYHYTYRSYSLLQGEGAKVTPKGGFNIHI